MRSADRVDSSPLVSIVVPAWREADPLPLATLLSSVAVQTHRPVEVVAVCNGQGARLLATVRQSPVVTRIAELSQNAGVARAWNIGAHLATGAVLVFVNEDVRLGATAIETILGVLREDDSIGLVGPRGSVWEVSSARAAHIEYVGPGHAVDCDCVSGFLFATPRSVWAGAGGFDDAYTPCSFEELDYAYRVRRLGKRTVVSSDIDCEHEWGVSASPGSTPIEFLGRTEDIASINLRNHAHFLARWAPREGEEHGAGLPDQGAQPVSASAMVRSRAAAAGLADGLRDTGVLPNGASVLAVGLLAQALEEPVRRESSTAGGALVDVPIGQTYDAVVALEAFQHMNDAEASLLASRVASVAPLLVTAVHHTVLSRPWVNRRPVSEWLASWRSAGWAPDLWATVRLRFRYMRGSPGPEEWHQYLFVLRRATTGTFTSGSHLVLHPRAWRALARCLTLLTPPPASPPAGPRCGDQS